jgi:6-phospho-beta-glucosidase
MTILGGSSVYIPELILSIIGNNLNVAEIALVGRSEKKLHLVGRFCQRLLDKSGFPTRVIGTSDVAEGVTGAKYILNNIRVGGMKARLRDEKLPPRMGMVGDESLGAGGIANALRTLPVLLKYMEVIGRVSPEATVINLTNPIGVCVEAMRKHTDLRVIGISDQHRTCIEQIAGIMGYPENEFDFNYIGLNHMGWVQDVKHRGRSCMGRLLDRIDQNREDGFDYELIDLFRMIPTSKLSLHFHQDSVLKRQQTTGRFRAEVLHEAEQQILRLYENDQLSDVPDLTRARNAMWYEQIIVPLLKALEGTTPERLILCVRNDGSIRDLPNDASVEVPVTVSRDEVTPVKIGNCPRFLKGLFQSTKESNRLVIEAVLHHSKEHALQALAINPLVPSVEAAKAFLDRIIREESLELH